MPTQKDWECKAARAASPPTTDDFDLVGERELREFQSCVVPFLLTGITALHLLLAEAAGVVPGPIERSVTVALFGLTWFAWTHRVSED